VGDLQKDTVDIHGQKIDVYYYVEDDTIRIESAWDFMTSKSVNHIPILPRLKQTIRDNLNQQEG
jgi:hypothetical protein